MKVALFLPNWLGDLVMATPTLRAIRERFGRRARLVGIVRPNLAELLDGTDWLDEQWCFDPRSKRSGLGHWSLLRRMRRQRLDMVLMLTNSLRPAVLAWLAGVGERIGYDRSGRGSLLTTRLAVPRRDGRIAPTPMVQYYLKLAEAAGCPASSLRLELALRETDRQAAETVWQTLGLRADGRVVALNSSGAYGAAKVWPAEHFGRLARRIVDELDHDVLVICGPGEQDTARRIEGHAQRDRVFSLADQPLGLSTTKGCLGRCRLVVSTDSGPRHVAAALGKPVITLLGPTVAAWIENPTVAAVHVQADLDCLGCGRRVCPLGHHRCMRELSADTVYEQVARSLEQGYCVWAA